MYIDIVINFQNEKKANEIKNVIEENRKVAWNTENFLILNFFDELINE